MRDSGIGVSAEAKPRLFAPFEQADSSIARRFAGTGLGLSIGRKLVELMGGEIGMQDRPGGGSVFCFEIALPRAEPSKSEVRETGAPGRIKAGRILLAEDHAVNAEVATYQVEVARNGADALAAARRSDFDPILMDLRMPGMDGLAAARQIRALPAPRGRAPILALTANPMADKRQWCLEAGMDDFVTEPYAPSQLREAVARRVDAAPRKGPGEPQPADEKPSIDGAVIDELRSVMTESQFAALVQIFVAKGEARAKQFGRGLAGSTPDEIADEAHALISASGALGARRVQRIATRLESACREDRLAAVRGLTEALPRVRSEASAELCRELAR